MKSLVIPVLIAAGAMAAGGCAGPGEDAHDRAGRTGSTDRALLDAATQPLDRARQVEGIAAGRNAVLDDEIEGSTQ